MKKLLGAAALIFLTLLLLVANCVQIASILLLPVSRKAVRAINRFVADTWWSLCVLTGKALHGLELKVTGDNVPEKENAILVCNHQQMADIYVIMFFARTKGRLGDLKWFVKDIIKYIPGIGWGMYFLDCVYVKRNWEQDKDKIDRLFSKYKSAKIPIWLISFVEGTRLKPVKLARSQKYARENGLPVFNHVMLPRTKGFIASVNALRDHVDAVYDLTISYPDGQPSMWQVLCGEFKTLHLHVKRYPIAQLPVENETLSPWLVDRFAEKDRFLAANP